MNVNKVCHLELLLYKNVKNKYDLRYALLKAIILNSSSNVVYYTHMPCARTKSVLIQNR
jgi:hypothetical protein